MIPVKGSYVEFFKNGISQGKAWENEIFLGEYYPCISIYKAGSVTVNFGPKFKFSPKTKQPFKPVQNRAYDDMIESCVADMVYAVDLEINGDKSQST